jgi:3-phenylpropionate/trans-cinnamate dioxygenase ferredoxin subunit
MIHTLCKVADIPDEGTRLVDFFGRSVHVYKAKGRPVAVANACLHFGGPLQCKDGKFVCDWHGAEFALESGERLKAPAPSNSRLMFLSTRVDGDDFNYVWGE